MYNIVFYEDKQGNKPVENFIDRLDAEAGRNKSFKIQLEQMVYCLTRLELSGTRSGEKFTKRISNNIWELRPGNNRILFFGWNGNNFVLLHHFAKTTRKTPPRELSIAEKRMEDWLSRCGGSERS